MKATFQTMNFYKKAFDIELFCPVGTKNLPNYQVMKVFTKYLKKHPEKLHRVGSFMVIFSLMDAFPCKKSE